MQKQKMILLDLGLSGLQVKAICSRLQRPMGESCSMTRVVATQAGVPLHESMDFD
jgi:hypothetical protein